MLPVALGLGAALSIGVSNIAAGLASRRLTPLIVGFWAQATGLALCTLLLLLLRPPLLPGQIAGGLIAGLAGGLGMVFFYRAMAAGAISLVSPITACAVVFPVLYAIASGENPTPLASAGIAAIIGGIVLASLQPAPVPGDPTDTGLAGDRRAIALAVLAAMLFGAFFILLDLAPSATGASTLWTAAAVRVSGFGVQAALVLAGPRRLSSPGRLAPAVLLAGALDLLSLILINIGSTTDAYGIVTALVGLYPVVAMLLGVVALRERLTRIQTSGAALAMAGVLLVSA